jgi:hypothetical protein
MTRLNEIHDIEFEDIQMNIRNKKPKSLNYKIHSLYLWLLVTFAFLFVCSGAFIIGIVQLGANNGRIELEELPRIINKAGYRRSLTLSISHW